MKARNIAIITLLCTGLAVFCLIQFAVKPRMERASSNYSAAQQNPAAHDFAGVLKYKSKYMGDASNDCNLNYHLPLGGYTNGFELKSAQFALIVNYNRSAWGLGEEQVKADLVYNATANFALIGNLKAVTFRVGQISYSVARDDVKAWYGVEPSTLAEGTAWKTKVQNLIGRDGYADHAFNAFFHTGAAPSATA